MADLIECDALIAFLPDGSSGTVMMLVHPDGEKLPFPVNFLQIRWMQRSLKIDFPLAVASITPVNKPFPDDVPRIPVDAEFLRLGLEQG